MPDLERWVRHRRSIDDIFGLLKSGADFYATGDDYGPAMIAAVLVSDGWLCWCSVLLQLLLSRGANINAVDSDHGTVLTAAAFRGNEHIISLLLYRDANVNIVGGVCGTALAAAALQGHTDIVLLLLKEGANINAVGGRYGTALGAAALGAAAYGGKTHIVALLLDRGADVNLVGGNYGTALLAAATSYESEDIVTLLLDKGADITEMGGEYGTVLATAAFSGDARTVSLLIDRGADVNKVGGKCETALGAAVAAQREYIVSLLLHHGADTAPITSELGTVLGHAIHQGSTAIVSLLLKHGASIIHVGGSYSTDFGVYPSALDAAHSEGSNAGPDLRALIETAIEEQKEPGSQDVDPVEDILLSRPPFPMPYSQPYSVLSDSHNKGTDTLPTNFRAGDNITSEQSNVRCHKLSEDTLSRSLTALVGLNEDAIKAKGQWIQNDIRYFVARKFDFGLAYSAARLALKDFNTPPVDSKAISIQRAKWHRHAQRLDEARLNAIEKDHYSSTLKLIVSPYSIMPRRIWDLKSNRVVDFRMLHAAQSAIKIPPEYWAVSHSWTNNMLRNLTLINQCQWPVPLPNDISLDDLRSELIALGAEHIWIDVVCLRQKGGSDPHVQLRQDEWALDVPTIGNIYRAASTIVRYFNGLGVRFSNEGWDDPRHWLQRAWTLQEIATENSTLNGGLPQDLGRVFLDSREVVSGIKLRIAIRPVIQLAEQVSSQGGCELYQLAREMSRRHASNPIDKISGLFYLLHTIKLPCYDERMTDEDFWRQCFHLLPVERKSELLFDFPYRGSSEQWFPTWKQVLDWPVRDPDCDHMRSWSSTNIVRDTLGEKLFALSNIWAIPNAKLFVTAVPGEYKVSIAGGQSGYYFYLPYISQEPINIQDNPVFTLVTEDPRYSQNWVVCSSSSFDWARVDIGWAWRDIGWFGEDVKVLKKVGVIRKDSCSDLLVGKLLQKMNCLFV